jgi:hypothetical protein
LPPIHPANVVSISDTIAAVAIVLKTTRMAYFTSAPPCGACDPNANTRCME